MGPGGGERAALWCHRIKGDVVAVHSCVERVDLEPGVEASETLSDAAQVPLLSCPQIHRWRVEEAEVVAAGFVGDEHHPVKSVGLNQKPDLIERGVLLAIGCEVAGQARRAARCRHAVVAREAEGFMEELIELLAVAAVAAIHGDGMDAFRVKWVGRDERRCKNWHGRLLCKLIRRRTV